MENSVNSGNKLILALNELCNVNFNTSDDSILEKLFTYIEMSWSSILEDCKPKDIEEWLEKVVSAWKKNEIASEVIHFSISFFGLLGSSPTGFNILQDNVLNHMLTMATETSDYDSRLVASLVNCTRLISKHDAGWQWVYETGIWKFAIKGFDENKSIYVNRAAKHLMLELFDSGLKNGRICDGFVYEMCGPLLDAQLKILTVDFFDIESDLSSEEDQIKDKPYQKLLPTSKLALKRKNENENFNGSSSTVQCQLRRINLIREVLEELLVANVSIPFKFSLNKGNLTACSQPSPKVLLGISNFALVVELSYQMSKRAYDIPIKDLPQTSCPFIGIKEVISWAVDLMSDQGNFVELVQFLVTFLTYEKRFKHWCKPLCSTCSIFEKTVVDCLSTFLTLNHQPPKNICTSLLNKQSNIDKDPKKDLPLELCATKISERLAERFSSFQVLESQFTSVGIAGLTRVVNLISKDTKRDILRDVIYEVHLQQNQNNHNDLRSFDSGSESKIVIQLLSLANNLLDENCLNSYIHHSGTEGITLRFPKPGPYMLLKVIMAHSVRSSDTRIAIAALQVLKNIMKLCFYDGMMSPNATAFKTTLSLFNMETIHYLLSHHEWEIRDSTLEVLEIIIGFICLVPWTFDYNDPVAINEVVLKLASDKQDEVRTSAIKFFSTAVRGKYFASAGFLGTIFDEAIRVLTEDNMQSVRRATCDLITALYINYVPAILDTEDVMHDLMFQVSLKEMDWEVKKAALKFWQCVIDKLLMNTIPSCLVGAHTTCFEVNKRNSDKIVEVFIKLGKIGCLKAIWIGLSDECDISVSQEAKDIVITLEKLWYQCNAVSSINYEKSEIGACKVEDTSKMLGPKEFFQLLSDSEWKLALNSRVQWIEKYCDGLDSILDLILSGENTMHDWDHNAVDCY